MSCTKKKLLKIFEGNYLKISLNSKWDIEDCIEDLNNIRELTLRFQISEFPYKILENKNLEIIDLSNNLIKKIDWVKAKDCQIENGSLTSLNMANNKLRTVPNKLLDLSSLKTLNLTHNPIRKKNLKRIYSKHKYKLEIDFEQNNIAKRTFHPVVVNFFIILSGLIIIAIPTFFDSNYISILLAIPVIIMWATFIKIS